MVAIPYFLGQKKKMMNPQSLSMVLRDMPGSGLWFTMLTLGTLGTPMLKGWLQMGIVCSTLMSIKLINGCGVM